MLMYVCAYWHVYEFTISILVHREQSEKYFQLQSESIILICAFNAMKFLIPGYLFSEELINCLNSVRLHIL